MALARTTRAPRPPASDYSEVAQNLVPYRVVRRAAQGGLGPGNGGRSVPALLDMAKAPDRQGDDPGDDEEADDDEAGRVDVEVGRRTFPNGAVRLSSWGNKPSELDGADEEGNGHRERR